jgi:hypothetical protein
MSQTATKTRARKGAKSATQDGIDRERCTLLLDADLSMKLSIEAHRRKKDRSKTINDLLSESLRHVVVSIRGQSDESARDAGHVNSPAPVNPNL